MTVLALERRTQYWRAAVVGAGAGILSGLFGVGGGIVLVPALLLFVKLAGRNAAATSLASVIPIAVSGLAGYAVAGEVDWALGAIITVGAIAGSRLGTALLTRLPERTLLFAFAGLLVLVAVRMFMADPSAVGRGPLDIGMALGALALGLFTGVLSGLFGVGGGFIIVPAMVLLFAETATLAKGSSLLVILPTALFGTWFNHQNELVEHRVAAVTGLSGAALSFLSAQVAVGLDERVANVSFAVLLAAVAARMGLSAWKAASR